MYYGLPSAGAIGASAALVFANQLLLYWVVVVAILSLWSIIPKKKKNWV